MKMRLGSFSELLHTEAEGLWQVRKHLKLLVSYLSNSYIPLLMCGSLHSVIFFFSYKVSIFLVIFSYWPVVDTIHVDGGLEEE